MNKPVSKQVEVQIMGQSYLLACPPGGETALLDAVGKVDTAMCRIRDAGKVKARDRIAVLASLNLAFELSQKESEILAQSSFGEAGSAKLGEPSVNSSSALDPATRERAQDLIRRLDQTLGNDGQLI